MSQFSRRAWVTGAAAAGTGLFQVEPARAAQIAKNAPVAPKSTIKITKLETILVKPRWLFLKIHTDAGVIGLGEPILEGRAKTCATAVSEVEPYLVGKD